MNNEKKKQIGNRIKNIRFDLGITQQEFGSFLGATRSNVSKWERGESLPNNERIKQISKIADITIEELLEDKNIITVEVTNRQRKTLEKLAKKEKKSIKEVLLDSIFYERKEINKKKVSQRIKEIRFRKGLTLEEFGELFSPKANRSLVSAWENARYLPNPERIKKIAEIEDIAVNELLYSKKKILKIDEEFDNELAKYKKKIDEKEEEIKSYQKEIDIYKKDSREYENKLKKIREISYGS